MTARSDAELVASARQGDHAALAQLLERHRPALLAVCRRALRDPALAEDAAQEAALQALVQLGQLRDAARFGPWIRRIGLNTCRYWTRQGARSRWSLEALRAAGRLREPGDAGGDPAAHIDEAVAVRQALGVLSEGQRAAVALCYLAGLPLARAAAVLGIEVGAVKTRLHKARRTLRLWLAPPAAAAPRPLRRPARFQPGGSQHFAGGGAAWRWGSARRLHFRIEVDTAALAEEILAFLRDASAARGGRPAIVELCLAVPETAAVLDAMLLDGVVERNQVAAYVRAVFGASAPAGRTRRPRRLFRLQVDADALTDELCAFVADPRASRYDRPVVAELHDVAPDMIPVLEHMLVEGVADRRHVAAYVRCAVGEMLA